MINRKQTKRFSAHKRGVQIGGLAPEARLRDCVMRHTSGGTENGNGRGKIHAKKTTQRYLNAQHFAAPRMREKGGC